MSSTIEPDTTVLSKEAKTATNKLTRDCRRRHSLSGGGEIFAIVYPDKSMSYFDEPRVLHADRPKPTPVPRRESISSATISTRAGILESHV